MMRSPFLSSVDRSPWLIANDSNNAKKREKENKNRFKKNYKFHAATDELWVVSREWEKTWQWLRTRYVLKVYGEWEKAQKYFLIMMRVTFACSLLLLSLSILLFHVDWTLDLLPKYFLSDFCFRNSFAIFYIFLLYFALSLKIPRTFCPFCALHKTRKK